MLKNSVIYERLVQFLSVSMAACKPTTQSTEGTQYPFRLMRPRLTSALKVFKIDLERLKQHKANVFKFKHDENMEGLRKEHVNAMLTVQKLKSNIEQLQNLRAQVREEDREKFSKEVESIEQQIKDELQLFVSVCTAPSTSHSLTDTSEGASASTNHNIDALSTDNGTAQGGSDPWPSDEDTVPLQIQEQIQLDAIDPEVEKTWSHLEESVEDLNEMMSQFSKMVHGQQEMVNTIEDNVTSADENVSAGAQMLAQAAKMQHVAFPIMGAVMGGALGGPFGILAGAKMGAMAAIGGGIAGFTGGQMMKKKMNSDTEQAEVVRLEQEAAAAAARNPPPDPEADLDPAPDPYAEDQYPRE